MKSYFYLLLTSLFLYTPVSTYSAHRNGEKHKVSVQKIGNQECVIADGVRGPVFDKVDHPKMTSDGVHIFYFAWKGDKQFVVIDEKLMEQDNHVIGDLLGKLVITSDGGHYAYTTFLLKENAHIDLGQSFKTKAGWVVLDGKSGPIFDDVRNIQFASDSKSLRVQAKKGRELFWETMKVE